MPTIPVPGCDGRLPVTAPARRLDLPPGCPSRMHQPLTWELHWATITQATVPPRWLCYTTIVTVGSPDDAELARLLAQLARLLVPGGDGAAPEPDGAAGRDTAPGSAGGQRGAGSPTAVSASEARALFQLVSSRGIAQGDLAGLLGLEKSTVSRLAAGMERKGWIRRGRDSGDQRYVRLYLTPQGTAVASRLWRAWQSRQRRLLAALTEEERAGLAAGLRGLLRGLSAEAPGNGAAVRPGASGRGAAGAGTPSAMPVSFRAAGTRSRSRSGGRNENRWRPGTRPLADSGA
jgi:DNA-binding MarR family transcriptional regulator